MDQDLGEHLRRAAQGDRPALERLLRRLDARVLHLAYRLLGNVDDAKDVRQWVLLKVTRSLSSVASSEAFEGWLRRVVVNACRDRQREHASQARLVARVEGTIEESAPCSSSLVERDEMGERVAVVVSELPHDEREVLVLRHYEGLSFPKIADLLGAPETTLKSRFSRALLRVAERMSQQDPSLFLDPKRTRETVNERESSSGIPRGRHGLS